MDVLFLGKDGDNDSARAEQFVEQTWPGARIYRGRRGEQLDPELHLWRGDLILSYLSPHILPGALLAQARVAALNFHPGPPEYPGTGCTNFALYHGATTYGVTCHHMIARVDAGPIVAVRRFPILTTDSVLTVTHRSYSHLAALFQDIACLLARGEPLPSSTDAWSSPPTTRAQLNALCVVLPEMSAQEVHRRVIATRYPGAPGAHVMVGGVSLQSTPTCKGAAP